MAEQSAISWTDSTFNPWIGCTKVSPACDHCYAARQDAFRKWTPEGWGGPRRRTSATLWRQPVLWNAQDFAQCTACGWRDERRAFVHDFGDGVRAGCPACGCATHRDARRRVFCASLADVFDNQVPDEWRHDLFELIRTTPRLDWLLLTKRPQNIVRMVRDHGAIAGNGTCYLPDNAALGTTAEDQPRADQNLTALQRTRMQLGARVLFASIEPMLGPVDVSRWLAPPCDRGSVPGPGGVGGVMCTACDGYGCGRGLDWIIAGGESGPHARPSHPDWFRSLRDQCAAAGVPFHFKQWGEWAPAEAIDDNDDRDLAQQWLARDGREVNPDHGVDLFHGDTPVYRAGVRHTGRLLDGAEHNDFPITETA
jgi:protein gp37